MLDRILKMLAIKAEMWELRGYDTFAGESYRLAGPFSSEKAAKSAAKIELEELEKTQPSGDSRGQQPGGIQDQIYIIRPDGSGYRYLPEEHLEKD